MAERMRYKMSSDSIEYKKGYSDGMKASFEASELDAYYAGVGYGKKIAGDKHIGFNSAEERRSFEHGIQNRNKHFNTYRLKKPSLAERLFGGKSSRNKQIDTRSVSRNKSRVKSAHKAIKYNKKRKR